MFVKNGHDRNYLNFITTKLNISHLKLKTQTRTSSNYDRCLLKDPK